MVVAVVQDKDAPRLLEALVSRGLRATKLSSTGGFLREGNTTLLCGVDDEQVPTVVGTVREVCRARAQTVTPLTPVGGPTEAYVPYPVEVVVGGATVFVLDVDHYERF